MCGGTNEVGRQAKQTASKWGGVGKVGVVVVVEEMHGGGRWGGSGSLKVQVGSKGRQGNAAPAGMAGKASQQQV